MSDELYNNDHYKNLKENSLKGASGRRTRETIRMSKKAYQNNLKIVAAASAIAVALTIGGGNAVYKSVKDNMTINSLAYNFHVEVMGPETHRTDDNEHYFYDYDDIAEKIQGMEEPDLGYYLFYKNTGTYQTDKVMSQTEYGSFENYLASHNYKDEKEFSKDMKERALLMQSIYNQENKLSELESEHETFTDEGNASYGGMK